MKYKDIIILLASAFIVVVAWIIFNIYHNSVESTTPEDFTKDTVPITPVFDQSTIDKLNSRAKISPIYDLVPPSSPAPSISITPEITISPVSTNSALIASPGGEILL
jgi:hypothetical protein